MSYVNVNVGGYTQGFLTNTGVFVDRITAATLALEAGLITKLETPPNLFTEDLWQKVSMNRIEFGDCRSIMKKWAAAGVKVQTCVTSPPYFGLRSYMPDAVRLRDDLSEEEKKAIEEELARLGIKPNFC